MSNNFKKVKVNLGPKTYEAHIGSGIIDQLPKLLSHKLKKSTGRAFIISDQSLLSARKKTKSTLQKSGWEVFEFSNKAGESFKDFKTIYPIYGWLLDSKATKDSVIIALGGGSIGDAVGFIASTYLRGIPWVSIPTTLVAQVDSGIGGKTGVNHAQGKNLIGTIYQPCLTICEINFLKTLSSRELISGLGEIIKYGFIFDRALFQNLEKNWKQVLRLNSKILTHYVYKSLSWKAKVVSQDEFDSLGIRESLNFGHTFGHALESVTLYKKYQHGEAVIWGQKFALHLSHLRNRLSKTELDRALKFLDQIPLPKLPQKTQLETYLKPMSRDKKNRGGKLHFVVLNQIGKYSSNSKITNDDLQYAFQKINNFISDSSKHTTQKKRNRQ